MSQYVEIVAEQLPEQLRPHLAAYLEAQKEAGETRGALQRAHISEKHKLTKAADDAKEAAAQAHAALLEATREQPGPMREYSHARFMAAVERAREHLQAAERELRAAAGHAAVHGAVRAGLPCVGFERGMGSPGRKRALFVVGLVQEAAGQLPEDVEG